MDIGSGKPTTAERQRVPHHCIDIVDPDYPFTAGEFSRRAAASCHDIERRGRIPLVVGGTGLYIDSLFFGLSQIPPVDATVRAVLYRELEERGLPALFHELAGVDPPFAARIHENDRQRILRGLEVFRGTGQPLSAYHGDDAAGIVSDETLFIGLELPRGELVHRIESRVDGMIAGGLVDEVRGLRERGYDASLKSMRSIGYAEVHEHLDGRASLDETVERIKTATRRYAKRQMTWFRKNHRVRWFAAHDRDAIGTLIRTWSHGGGASMDRQ